VTPEEIRRIGVMQVSTHLLQEIAAQLAEQTTVMRADAQQRKEMREQERDERIKRDRLLASSSSALEAYSQAVAAPPAPPMSVEFSGTVQHLGCIIRQPDGEYKIVTNQGQLLDFSKADYQRILAPPPDSEAKPQ
jgi:hypothetical protein